MTEHDDRDRAERRFGVVEKPSRMFTRVEFGAGFLRAGGDGSGRALAPIVAVVATAFALLVGAQFRKVRRLLT